ncbi:unnamed protein product [Caenorhabditis nigoni]
MKRNIPSSSCQHGNSSQASRPRSRSPNIFLEDNGIPLKQRARATRGRPKYVEESEDEHEDSGVFSPDVSGFPDPSNGANALEPKEIYKNSTRWFAISCLKSVIEAGEGRNVNWEKWKFSKEVMEKLEELFKEVKEHNCHSFPVNLSEEMPSSDNYRGLDTVLFDSVNPSPPQTGTRRSYCRGETPKDMNFTGKLFMDIQKAKGKKIVEAAKQRIDTKYNTVYEGLDRENVKCLMDEKLAVWDVVDREIRFFEDRGAKITPGYVPVPIFTMPDNSDETIEKIQKLAEISSVCLIRNICQVTGFDSSAFELKELTKIKPKYEFVSPRQVPQATWTNFDRTEVGDKSKQSSNKWDFIDVHQRLSMEEFEVYYEKVRNVTRNALLTIQSNPSADIELVLKNLEQSLHDASLPVSEEAAGFKVDPDATLIAFGSNIDLEQEDITKFKIQNENVQKLPEFLRPDAKGDFTGYVRQYMNGINTPQVYVKLPGVRTVAHIEDGTLASVNLNLGPGTSVWFCTPLEFAGKLQKLVIEKCGKRTDKIFDLSFWPFEKDCLEAKIPIQKFLQEPGDLVYVGLGSYHWVQANDFTTQVSWNVAPPNFRQLAMLAISNDHYLVNGFKSQIPVEYIIWNMAKLKVTVEEKVGKLMKAMLCRSLAKCQYEFDFCQKHSLPIVSVSESAIIYAVELCIKCKVIVFNLIPMDKVGETFCFGCAVKAGKLPEIKIYRRLSMEQLVQHYNSFLI